jgi:hypothetical protein
MTIEVEQGITTVRRYMALLLKNVNDDTEETGLRLSDFNITEHLGKGSGEVILPKENLTGSHRSNEEFLAF